MWGRRKLAYPIQKYQEGYYVFFNFKFPSEVAELKRWMGLNEEVIRHLLVKEDEKEGNFCFFIFFSGRGDFRRGSERRRGW